MCPLNIGQCAAQKEIRRTDVQNKRFPQCSYKGRKPLLEYLLRFIVGGIAVSVFAAFSDALRPKSFAGLFGAAPSIALATLLITLSQKGAPFAAVEGRSMIAGAFALAAYSWTVCLLLKRFMVSSWTATMAAFIVWFAVAFGLCTILFGPP